MSNVDYWIAEVCYDSEKTHINSVKVHKQGEVGSNISVWSRLSVVDQLKLGIVIYTMYEENGDWKVGAKVEIIKVNGIEYIRTDSNSTAKDNLGDLPEFC